MNSIFLEPINLICKDLQSPITCQITDSVSFVLDLFQEHKIGCVIVMSGDFIAGIFTERDYILKIAGNEDLILTSFRIEDYMTKNPQTISHDAAILMGMNYMRVGKYRHLVVVDENKMLQKVLSIKDFMDYFIDTSDI